MERPNDRPSDSCMTIRMRVPNSPDVPVFGPTAEVEERLAPPTQFAEAPEAITPTHNDPEWNVEEKEVATTEQAIMHDKPVEEKVVEEVVVEEVVEKPKKKKKGRK